MVDDVAEKLKKKLNIFDEDAKDDLNTPPPPPPPVVLPPPAAVQQAPFKIRNLFPSIRLNVYAILQGKTIPKTVTLRGSTADGDEIELPIPVTISHLPNEPAAPPAIHALAARKIIQDLEDGQHALVQTLSNPDDTDLLARTVKASIVRLGKTYSVSSTHTSFVAVDEARPDAAPPAYWVAQPVSQHVVLHSMAPHAMAPPSVHAFYSLPPQPHVALGMHMMSSASNTSYASAPGGSPSYGGGWNAPVGSAPPTIAAYAPPTIAAYAPPPRQQQSTQFLFGAAPAAALSDLDGDQFSGLSPSMSFGGATDPVTSGGAAAPIMFGGATAAMTNDRYMQSQLERKKERKMATGNKPHRPQMTATDIADPLEALARLQSFDGCFSLDVINVIKLNTTLEHVRGAFPAGATDAVVATVIGLAFLSTKLGATVDRDSWEGMYEKAQQYVEAALRDLGSTETVDVLETKIAKMLA
ncbi:hypothetical protein B0H10DRAFT_878898 [Mycena sp. CBHHK59/15]|nr:hypothetical protein B0H10DRAFT_878898 [Mycena sp. CBHHK59/15]